jgi:hypothetical protein
VRRHPVLEHLEVSGVGPRVLAARRQRRQIVGVPVQPLPAP